MTESDDPHKNQPNPESTDNALNFLNSRQNETEPTPKDILGFVPLTKAEKNRAIRLYEAYQEDETHGVAKYLSLIARSRQNKGKAAAAVFSEELIAPYKESIKHQDTMQAAKLHAPELGRTLFEDEGYDDSARDTVAVYLKAKQENNGVRASEQVSLKELMNVITDSEVVDLIEEVYSNAVLRESFWHRIIDSARDPYRLLDKIATENDVPRIDPSKDVQRTEYKRGSVEDPEVAHKRRESDKPY